MTDIITIPEIHAGLPALTAGIASGMYSIRLYLRMPAGWVCETGEMPRTEHMPFMRLHMWKGVYYRMGIICGAVVFLYLIRHIFCFCFFPASAVCIILALIALSAAAQADSIYFILPDQLTAFILAAGIFSGFSCDLARLFLPEILHLFPTLPDPSFYPAFRCRTFCDFLTVFPFSSSFNSAAGALLSFLTILFCAVLSLFISGHQGIGAGDIKLIGACGALTGVSSVPFLIFFASSGVLCSALKDVIFRKYSPGSAKPAGPWIFVSSAACLLLF